MSNNQELMYSVSNHNAFDIFNSILNEENEENDNDNSNDYCLISNESLNNSKVVLPCGHCFNYLPLLNDLINYKKTHHNRILCCPYCRKKIEGTIPYRYDISKINCREINIPTTNCYLKNKCCNENCESNATIPHLNDTFICYTHYKLYNNKKIRQQNRENKKKQLMLEKSNRKTTKLNKSAEEFENKIVTNQKTHNICKAILKTGKRRGDTCNAKITDNSATYCKRHNTINQFEEQEYIKKLKNLENNTVSN